MYLSLGLVKRTHCLAVNEIKVVKATDHLDDIVFLTEQHWDEVGFDFNLSLSKELYGSFEDCNALICLAAFDDDEKIIGYSTGLLMPHIFNPSIRVCQMHALFVEKNKRSSTVPGRLMLETERVAKERGAQLLIWQTRAGTGLATTLAKRGYTESDVAMMKEI